MKQHDWRVIPDFPDYEITRHGMVRRATDAKTAKAGWLLKTHPNRSGYVQVVLRRSGKSLTQYVHSLVLSAFVGPRPSNIHQAAHLNGNRQDNRIENLRWALPAENAQDKKRHGTDLVGMRHHSRKISDADVIEIRRLRAEGVYCKDIARKFGVHTAYVSLVASRKRWTHI